MSERDKYNKITQPEGRHPVIGVLGGMGPEATVDLMRRVIKATPAQDDNDHVHMIIDNNPKVPSRIAALIEGTGESPLPTLCTMARRLESAGANILAMPCNTAHNYLADIRQAVVIPFLDMIELTALQVKRMELNHRRVGLLASTAVKQLGLYDKALANADIQAVYPARQAELMALIKAVKRGDTGADVRREFIRIADQLLSHDSDLIVIACTELSVLADSLDETAPVIDALEVLAGEIVAFGRGLKQVEV